MNSVEAQFKSFVRNYDTNDEAVCLKIKHTAHVAKQAAHIAQALGLSIQEQDLAMTIGWLHDIGRFEQLQQYHTFIDAKSVNHATLGVSLLTDNNALLLRKFNQLRENDELICFAIAQHNCYQLATHKDKRTLLHAKIIRDADKIDIFRVNIEAHEHLLFSCDKETLQKDIISDHIYAQILSGKPIVTAQRSTHLDVFVSHLAMVFDINFDCSKKQLYDLGYIQTLFKKYTFENNETKMRMTKIENIILFELNNRVEGK